MIATLRNLQRLRLALAAHPIDQPMLAVDPPGPPAFQIAGQRFGLAGAANYAASKGGLIAMTKTLAKELGRKRILVNAVNPGFMRSSMTESVPEEVLKQNIEMSPLKSFTDPEEVADFLIYLSSDKMRQVTGQVFHFESRPF